MGYQVVAGRATADLSDEAWSDLIALASRHGFSAPRLLLERRGDTDLTDEEVEGLNAALKRALSVREPAENIAAEDDTLDRDTVRRVDHVLRQEGLKIVRRTPAWPGDPH